MSIEAKQLILHEINNKVGEYLTIKESGVVLQAISEIISKYSIERDQVEERDIEGSELLEAFITAKRIEGRSDKTLERYSYIIKRLYREIDVPVREISVYHIRRYFGKEKERGVSDRTLESTREVLSSFFGWLQKESLLPTNPIINLGSIKYAKKQRQPYSQTDIEKLKAHCKTYREKAIIAFLLSTGCRISEMCSLNKADIDYQNRECVVMGKGEKERTVFIDDITSMYLSRYIDERKDNLEALFVGKRNERLTPGGVRYILNKIAAQAGVENTHPHRFRRTLATNLIDHGMPIQEVSVLLGHEKIDTTMTYVYIDKTSVKNAYRKYA